MFMAENDFSTESKVVRNKKGGLGGGGGGGGSLM